MPNQYRFITRWRVKGTAEEVFAILSEPLEYPRWWPSVYLMVRETAPGSVSLLTRGWLPYTVRWQAKTGEVHRPDRMVVQANGDFEGRGIWSMVQDGPFTDVTF